MSGIGTGTPCNRRGGARALLVVSVVVVLDSPAWGQDAKIPFSPEFQTGASAASPSRVAEPRTRRIGPPQVVEIPLPEPSLVPSPSWYATVEERSNQNEPLAAPARTTSSALGYLGVLYATAEDGPGGVRVLDVIAGSPAERAGFSASPPPPPKTAQVLTAIVSVLMALAPVAALAIALDLAPDVYTSQPPERGDLITAVAGHPVRDALEFNDVMHRFGPGDTVTFGVQRGRTQVRLSAQLAAEP